MKRGATVGAGNYSYFNVGMIVGICFCEAFRKTGTRKRSVGVDGTEHGLPSAVTEDFKLTAVGIKRGRAVKIASARHIRLTYY
jgi:hypothetical protein